MQDVFSVMLECPHNMVAGFFQIKEREQNRKHRAFYNLILQVTYHHFSHVVAVHGRAWEETTQEGEYQEVMTIGGCLRGCSPQGLRKIFEEPMAEKIF